MLTQGNATIKPVYGGGKGFGHKAFKNFMDSLQSVDACMDVVSKELNAPAAPFADASVVGQGLSQGTSEAMTPEVMQGANFFAFGLCFGF